MTDHVHAPGRRVSADGDSPGAADPRRWFALVVLISAQFMIVLDATIVNVAMAAIQRDLSFSPTGSTWVINAYVLVLGSLLLLGGRLGDRLGRRTVFLAGLGVFTAASLACGLASSDTALIVARCAQGFGAALIAPTALALILATFRDGRERGNALAGWGAVGGVAGAAGVLLGGVLTDRAGWEWVFLINVPFAALAALVAPAVVRESRGEASVGFDVPGAALVTAGLAALVYGIVGAEEHGWTAARSLALFAGSTVLLAAFVGVERRTAHPLVDFTVFRLRSVSVGNALGFLLGGAVMTSMFYFCSLYLQLVLGHSAQETGLAFLPLALVAIASAGASSPLIARFGVRPVVASGFAVVGVGLAWFAGVDAGGSFTGDFLFPSLVVALGFGPMVVGVTVAATAELPIRQAGLASGLINSAQQVGGAIGLAAIGTVASDRTAGALGSGDALPVALTDGYVAAFAVAAGIMLAGAALAAVLLPSGVREPSHEPDAVPVPSPLATASGAD